MAFLVFLAIIPSFLNGYSVLHLPETTNRLTFTRNEQLQMALWYSGDQI
jgi:hypothetical protein